MNKLILAVVGSALATTAAAQTGTINAATAADHGTSAYHAEVTKQQVEAGKSVDGLSGNKAKQDALKESTAQADQGTFLTRSADAQRNVSASKGAAKPLASDKARHEALKEASKDAKP